MSVNDIASIAPIQGGKSVAVAGTPVQLSATSTRCDAVILTARKGNTGSIAYGFSNTVRATAGAEVGAILTPGSSVVIETMDVANVWIDATTNGEGVGFSTQVR